GPRRRAGHPALRAVRRLRGGLLPGERGGVPPGRRGPRRPRLQRGRPGGRRRDHRRHRLPAGRRARRERRGGHHRPARDRAVARRRGRRRARPRRVEAALMILRHVWPLWVVAVVFLPLLTVCALAAVRARRSGDGTLAAWLRRGGMVLALLAIALGPAVPSTTT